MGNHANECFCLVCNKKRKVGKDAKEEIEGDMVYIYCSECNSELYNYKISVKKSRNVKADHKTKS